MTVILHVGRRVPKSWYRRGAAKIKGLISFQENIWQMISQGVAKSKKAILADGRMTCVIINETESEDMNYQIEWKKVIIQGTPAMEEDEHKDILVLYSKIGKQFKKDFEVDPRLSKHFKSKLSDADSENSETQLWLEFAFACEYISEKEKNDLQKQSNEVGKLINYMINNSDKFN